MNKKKRTLIIASLLVAIGVAIFARHTKYQNDIKAFGGTELIGSGLPVLLELGSVNCIPCRAMAPILRELKNEYAGGLKVAFVDVWKDTEAGKRYEVSSIPTQIFFDSSGKELFRHTGFFAKEEILAKWKELGVELNKVK